MIVDDEPDARELCGSLLARYGATVETAASVREAVERIGALKPDVVVADLGMPDEDGFELIRRLRADESDRGRRTVVVALSAFVSEQDRRRALTAGFDAHVAKPFDPDELAATIATLLRPSSSS
jgi:CheY-like chemotaxis protein